MVVNSINFWLFFAVVLIPYFVFLRKNGGRQNLWLLLASYFFYGWADWKMIPLLVMVTIVFYWLGLNIKKNNKDNPKLASRLTTLGVVLGIGVLVYFKYLGFMVQEFAHLFESFGLKTNLSTFNIIMPIGISFFTFKLISYVIEIHREKIEPTNNLILFSTYIAFFPTILSGPIDKPNTFLPQLEKARDFKTSNVSEGLKRVLWGMFLKMCIADRISPWTDAIFNNYSHHNATSILVASLFYLIQMYADFCGYSDMAIGTAKIMGLDVIENFNRPFFAQNVAEYWRRWHISLTKWITDYVFMTLNVAWMEWKQWGLYLATVVNLVVIGVWHGANWTYALFGLYHGLLLVLTMMVEKKRKNFEKKHELKNNEWYKWSRRGLTFLCFTIGAVLFRSTSVSDFFGTVAQLGSGFGAMFTGGFFAILTFALPAIVVMFFREWIAEYKRDIHFFHSKHVWVRVVSIALMISYIIYGGELDGNTFIYFQF